MRRLDSFETVGPCSTVDPPGPRSPMCSAPRLSLSENGYDGSYEECEDCEGCNDRDIKYIYIITYFIVLYCTILYFFILYYIVLYCIILYYIILYYIVLYCIILYMYVYIYIMKS